MAVISNGTTLIDNGTLDSAVPTGKLILLSTQTASSSASISFTSSIDSTYDSYIFKLYDIHPSSQSSLTVNFRDGGSSFDATKTTSFFHAYHDEANTEAYLEYASSSDLAQSTSDQRMFQGPLDNDNDSSCVAEMILFDPSSTSFTKHFIGRSNGVLDVSGNPYSRNGFFAGYCNTTTAINGVQFAMESGNIDSGTIKMYGVA